MYSSNVKQIIKYMLVIPVIKGNVEKALKQFKRKFKQTGILKNVRDNKSYTKKSTKRKLA